MSRDSPVYISGQIKHETDLAYLFHDGQISVWLPKSQCEWDEDDKAMSIPEWLAYEKELI